MNLAATVSTAAAASPRRRSAAGNGRRWPGLRRPAYVVLPLAALRLLYRPPGCAVVAPRDARRLLRSVIGGTPPRPAAVARRRGAASALLAAGCRITAGMPSRTTSPSRRYSSAIASVTLPSRTAPAHGRDAVLLALASIRALTKLLHLELGGSRRASPGCWPATRGGLLAGCRDPGGGPAFMGSHRSPTTTSRLPVRALRGAALADHDAGEAGALVPAALCRRLSRHPPPGGYGARRAVPGPRRGERPGASRSGGSS
jgi:hypothetical protein